MNKNLEGLKAIVKIKCIFIFSDWIKCAIANKENQRKHYIKVLYKVCTKWCKRLWITHTIKRSLPFFKDFSLNWHRIYTLFNFRLICASISHFIALHFTVLNRFFFFTINCILCQLFSFYMCLETKIKNFSACFITMVWN